MVSIPFRAQDRLAEDARGPLPVMASAWPLVSGDGPLADLYSRAYTRGTVLSEQFTVQAPWR